MVKSCNDKAADMHGLIYKYKDLEGGRWAKGPPTPQTTLTKINDD